MEITSLNSRCGPVSERRHRLAGATAILLVLAGAALAAEVRITVKDDKGRAIEDAVVWVEVRGASRPGAITAEIVQKQRRFLPALTVIPVGSTVRFPNRDDVQHHVYSFSPPRKFDLPLYIGESPRSIVFDQPGVVTLGCNIHDWMAAHIIVVDSPFFAVSNLAGTARISALPGGPAVVKVWHPRLRGDALEWPADLTRGLAEREFTLKLRPEFRRTPPGSEGGTYR